MSQQLILPGMEEQEKKVENIPCNELGMYVRRSNDGKLTWAIPDTPQAAAFYLQCLQTAVTKLFMEKAKQ